MQRPRVFSVSELSFKSIRRVRLLIATFSRIVPKWRVVWNLRSALVGEPDDFGIAAAFEIEHAVFAPPVFVIAD